MWPGILSNAGSPRLEPTGFELQPGAAHAVPAPSGWSGRMWARTGCSQDGATGRLVCATGDCGSSAAECAGAGAASLTEFTIDGSGGLDFYDVSLVDGYNLPVLVETSGGGGSSRPASCATAGCVADLNAMCPAAVWKVTDGLGGWVGPGGIQELIDFVFLPSATFYIQDEDRKQCRYKSCWMSFFVFFSFFSQLLQNRRTLGDTERPRSSLCLRSRPARVRCNKRKKIISRPDHASSVKVPLRS